MKPFGVFGPLGDGIAALLLWCLAGILWIAVAPTRLILMAVLVASLYTLMWVADILIVMSEISRDIESARERADREMERLKNEDEEVMDEVMSIDEYFGMM